MKSISQSIQQRPTIEPTKARCRRDLIVEDFLSRLNPSRQEAGYRPYTATWLLGRIAKSGRRTDEESLHALYRECEKARSFGRLFSALTASKRSHVAATVGMFSEGTS